jgi:hypothetical protein
VGINPILIFGAAVLGFAIGRWPQPAQAVAESAATIAIAIFAWLTWRNEEQRKADKREAAEQRVSFLAYNLAREIRSWHRQRKAPVTDILEWALENHERYGIAVDVAEKRVDEISALTTSLHGPRREAARQATVLFLRATGFVNQEIEKRAHVDGIRSIAETFYSFSELISLLDRELIEVALATDEMAAADRVTAGVDAFMTGATRIPIAWPIIGGSK